MTLLALLLVGAIGAAGTAWALPRGGTVARTAALGGVAGLALIAVLAAATPTPTPGSVTPDATGAGPGTLWNGGLVANGYLRLVVALAAATAVGMSAITWLLRGVPGLRGLLPASLAALVGTTVALGASSPLVGLVAAGATGLASIPVLLTTPRAVAAGVAAREVRIAVASALVVLAVASVLPTLSRLVASSSAGDPASAGSGIAAAVAFGLLAIALVVAARVGAIPYHVRVSALTDSAAEGSLPLVLAWLPLPLAAVSAGVVLSELAPLGLPVGSAQALIIVLALLATIAAALAAALQDDVRHAVGYLTLADLGLVVLAFAALDPAAWGPARTWLLTAAVTKSALAAWAVVAEDRFETRSVPDLRGWLRPSPLLGVALALIVLATYGLPGWAVLTARLDLTRLAAGAPWGSLLLVASLLTLPAYARWLWLGIGVPTSHVDGATPEFLALRASSGRIGRLPRPPMPRRGRDEGLPVEQETDASYSATASLRPAPTAVSPSPSSPSSARRTAPRAELSPSVAARRVQGEPASAVSQSGDEDRSLAPEPASRVSRTSAIRRPAMPAPAAVEPAAAEPAIAEQPPRRASRVVAVKPEPAPDPTADAGADLAADAGHRPAGSRLGIRAILSRHPESPDPKPIVETKLWGDPDAVAPLNRAVKPVLTAKRPVASPRVSPVPTASAPTTPVQSPGTKATRVPARVEEPTLFDLPDRDRPIAAEPGPASPPELGSVRAGTGVGRRARPPSDKSGSSLMAAPRSPEASKALSADWLAPESEADVALASADVTARPRRGRSPSGPNAAARAATGVRRHRTDLLSAAVLALALLATAVAAGAFGMSKAACEPTQAVPTVSSTCS